VLWLRFSKRSHPDRRSLSTSFQSLGAEWLARPAPSFRETGWKEIADLYAILEGISPSPLHTLNRAVAVAEWRGPEAALAALG
jgi:predicted RNA polymerase sigma factor